MRYLPLLLAALLAAPAHADFTPALERELSPAYDRCMKTGDAAQGVDPAMLACGHDEQVRQDARLNARYRAVMARLDTAGKQRLRASERAWIKTRDRTCDPVFSATGGTIDRLNGSGCLLEQTIRRRLWLQRYR